MRVLLIIVLMSLAQQGWSQNLYGYYVSTAIQKYKAGDLDGAISYGNRAVKMYPDSILPYWILADCYAANRYLDESVKCYSKVLELGDSSVYIFRSRGGVYERLKEYDLAVADFKTGLRRFPSDTSIRLDLADVYSLHGQFEEVKLVLDSIGSFSSRHNQGYYLRGLANQRLKQYEAAIADYKEFNKNDSTFQSTYYSLAECYKELGRTTEMCETLRDFYERTYFGEEEYKDGDCAKILKYKLKPIPEAILKEREQVLPPPQEVIMEERTIIKTD